MAERLRIAQPRKWRWIQLLLIFAISARAGFIVLDGMIYLLMALVFSVGFDVISARPTGDRRRYRLGVACGSAAGTQGSKIKG